MSRTNTLQNRVFFFTIMTVLALLGLWLVSGYLAVIVFSLVMVIILKPVYDRFERWFRGRASLATTATLVALLLAIIIPGWIMLSIISNQVNAMLASLEGDEPLTLETFQTEVNNLVNQVPLVEQWELSDEQVAKLQQAAVSGATWLGSVVVNLGMSIPGLMAKLFIFLAILGVLLPNYHQFVRRLIELSPLDDEVDRIFLRKIKAMVWSMFVGIAVIALVQGIVTGLFIWLGDVPYAPLWTLIAIVFSTLPLGSSIVAIPLAIVQLVLGNPIGSLIILGGYLLVVTNLDNILRPRLVSKDAYLDAALVLVAALGGYDLFGFFGVIYGPVLMVLLMTAIDIYGEYYSGRERVSVADQGEPEPQA